MNNNLNNFNETEDYDEYEYDEYDIQPNKVRAGGGGTNKSFHSGKGTRAKQNIYEKSKEKKEIKKKKN
jgi:hypothetical protein